MTRHQVGWYSPMDFFFLIIDVWNLSRVCCTTAIEWAPITCSNRTNITTSPTIRAIKSFNAVATMTFSSSGSPGDQRSASSSSFCLSLSLSLYFNWFDWSFNELVDEKQGTEGFGKMMDRYMELTGYMVEKLRQKPDRFQLIVAEPECTNVCFWYVPARFRTMAPGPERDRLLGQITPILKGRMMTTGTLMVGYQPQGQLPNFFRSIISNQAVSEVDIDFLVEEIDRLGTDL